MMASGGPFASWIAVAVAAVAGITAYVAVGAVRRYALRRGVLDRPNERSSHVIPTPRGGGLGIVVVLLAAAPVCAAALGTPPTVTLLLAAAVAAVAVVGWLDDRSALAVGPRMAVHLAAAAAVTAVAVGANVGAPVPLPAWGITAWWLIWTVSAINVVNFMDGIDGLIASQMVLYGAYVASAAPTGSPVALLGGVFAGASAGFLAWNWSPARIFLGDVGSGALGIAAVVVGIALLRAGDASVARVYLPLLPVFADATVTIVRRALRRERIWSAHREHLYQRLANGPWTHARTATVYLALAAVGAAVGLVTPPTLFAVVVGAYGAAVIASGLALERMVRAASA